MLSAAGQRATGAMHRALTAYDLQSAAVESGSTALVRSMSLVSLSGDSSGRNLAPGSALSSRVARLLDGTLVYYADADGGSSPFSVQLDDFRMAGGTSRVCHLTQATRAIDIASLVAREEGMEQPPRLFLEGIELQPDALVCKIARPGSVVLLVPQLTELVSFFVSKVALVRPAAAPMVEAVGEVKSALSTQLLSTLGQPPGSAAPSRLHQLPLPAPRPASLASSLLSPTAASPVPRLAAPAAAARNPNHAALQEKGDVRTIVNYRGKALADSTKLRQLSMMAGVPLPAAGGAGGAGAAGPAPAGGGVGAGGGAGGGCVLGGANGASGPRTQLHVMLRDNAELPRLPTDAGSRLLGERVLQMVRAVGAGLDSGRQPELIADGLGGAYFLHDEADKLVGIFKPIDEEPYAPANPKGFTGGREAMGALSQAKAGVSVGRAAQRECAAYLLDHCSWAGVPHTAMLWVLHTAAADGAGTGLQVELKSGSFQRYVPHSCSADELGPSLFATATLQRVACFDLRVCNSDRHAGNLLVQRQADRDRERADAADAAAAAQRAGGGGTEGGADGPAAAAAAAGSGGGSVCEDARSGLPELSDPACLTVVPIDHGFILPHYRMLGEMSFDWASWPQASAPLSEEDRAYVASLDSHADAAMLRIASSLPEECLLSLHLGTMLLQQGVAAGLTLSQIAGLATRDGRTPSVLERAVEYAEGAAEAEAQWVVPLQLPSQLPQLPQPVLRLHPMADESDGSPPTASAPPGTPLTTATPGNCGATGGDGSGGDGGGGDGGFCSSGSGSPLARGGLDSGCDFGGGLGGGMTQHVQLSSAAAATVGRRRAAAANSTSDEAAAGGGGGGGGCGDRGGGGARRSSPQVPPRRAHAPSSSGGPGSPSPPPSPIESPLLRQASPQPQRDREAWERAFLAAARRYLAREIDAVRSGERRASGGGAASCASSSATASPRAIPGAPHGGGARGGGLDEAPRFLPSSLDSAAGSAGGYAHGGGPAGGAARGPAAAGAGADAGAAALLSLDAFSRARMLLQPAAPPSSLETAASALPAAAAARAGGLGSGSGSGGCGGRFRPASSAALGGFGGLGSGGGLTRGPAHARSTGRSAHGGSGGSGGEQAAKAKAEAEAEAEAAKGQRAHAIGPLLLPPPAAARRRWPMALPSGKAWADLDDDDEEDEQQQQQRAAAPEEDRAEALRRPRGGELLRSAETAAAPWRCGRVADSAGRADGRASGFGSSPALRSQLGIALSAAGADGADVPACSPPSSASSDAPRSPAAGSPAHLRHSAAPPPIDLSTLGVDGAAKRSERAQLCAEQLPSVPQPS